MRAQFIALALSLLALAGCDGADKHEEASRKVADCGRISNRVFGVLAITGKPGENVRLEATCGGTLVLNCVASIPQGATEDSCILGPAAVSQVRGAYLCAPVVLNGAPTVIHDCRIVP